MTTPISQIPKNEKHLTSDGSIEPITNFLLTPPMTLICRTGEKVITTVCNGNPSLQKLCASIESIWPEALKTKRANALVLTANIDHNLAFELSVQNNFEQLIVFQELERHYDVTYRRISDLTTLCKAIDEQTKKVGPIALLILRGHGGKYHITLDTSNKLKIGARLPSDSCLQNLSPRATIAIQSCSVGEGKENEPNLANYIARHSPRNAQIFSPTALANRFTITSKHPIEFRFFGLGRKDITYKIDATNREKVEKSVSEITNVFDDNFQYNDRRRELLDMDWFGPQSISRKETQPQNSKKNSSNFSHIDRLPSDSRLSRIQDSLDHYALLDHQLEASFQARIIEAPGVLIEFGIKAASLAVKAESDLRHFCQKITEHPCDKMIERMVIENEKKGISPETTKQVYFAIKMIASRSLPFLEVRNFAINTLVEGAKTFYNNYAVQLLRHVNSNESFQKAKDYVSALIQKRHENIERMVIERQKKGFLPEETRQFYSNMELCALASLPLIGSRIKFIRGAFKTKKVVDDPLMIITKRRKIVPEDIGISSEVFFANRIPFMPGGNNLRGSITLKKDILKIKMDWVQSENKIFVNWLTAMSHLKNLARVNKATTLHFEANIVNPKLLNIMTKRYGKPRLESRINKYEDEITYQIFTIPITPSTQQSARTRISLCSADLVKRSHISKFLKDDSGSIRISKRPSVTGKEMINHFKKRGYEEVPGGGKGDHRKLRKPGRSMIIIPYTSKTLSQNLASQLWKVLEKETSTNKALIAVPILAQFTSNSQLNAAVDSEKQYQVLFSEISLPKNVLGIQFFVDDFFEQDIDSPLNVDNIPNSSSISLYQQNLEENGEDSPTEAEEAIEMPSSAITLNMDQPKSSSFTIEQRLGNSLQLSGTFPIIDPKKVEFRISKIFQDIDSSISLNPLEPKNFQVKIGKNIEQLSNISVLITPIKPKKSSVITSTTVKGVTIGGQLNLRNPKKSTISVSAPVPVYGAPIPIGLEMKLNRLKSANLTIGLPIPDKVNRSVQKFIGIKLPSPSVSLSVVKTYEKTKNLVKKVCGFGRKKKRKHKSHDYTPVKPSSRPITLQLITELKNTMKNLHEQVSKLQNSVMSVVPLNPERIITLENSISNFPTVERLQEKQIALDNLLSTFDQKHVQLQMVVQEVQDRQFVNSKNLKIEQISRNIEGFNTTAQSATLALTQIRNSNIANQRELQRTHEKTQEIQQKSQQIALLLKTKISKAAIQAARNRLIGI